MSNLYESIINNDGMDHLKSNIIKQLQDNNLNDEEKINALVASTSMGFNVLFETLSKMVANSYILDQSLDEINTDDVDSVLLTVANDTINLIKDVGTSISNDVVGNITTNMQYLVEKFGDKNESASDSESSQDGAEDLS